MASDWFILLVSLVLGVSALGFSRWRRYSQHFEGRGMPFIPPLPFVGNLLSVMLGKKSLSEMVAELYDRSDPHLYVGVFAFAKPLVMIRDPEVLRSITVKDFDHFTDHLTFDTTDKGNPLLKKMLFQLEGREWHDMRTTLSPAFTSMKMKNMFVLMSNIGHQMVKHLTNKSAGNGSRSGKEDILTLEIKDFFTRITSDVIATTAFGVEVDSLSEPNNVFYKTGYDLTNVKPLVGIGYQLSPKIMEMLGIPFFDLKTVEFYRSIVSETIRTREKHGITRPDMIHLLMQARRGELTSDEEVKNGTAEGKAKRLTEDDIAAQVMLFFFGGFDTVATALTFCSYLLARHVDVQKRLQQEVDDLMEQSDREPSYEQVMGGQYLDMVISETMRLYAPVAVLTRQCVRAYRLPASGGRPGVELRPGDGIWVPVHGIHRDPTYYPEPERFDPERFSPENKQLIQPFTYYAFGTGPRMCIAQRFALMEMKVVLIYLLSKFSIQVVPKTPVPLKLDPSNSVSVSIKGGAWLGIRPRS